MCTAVTYKTKCRYFGRSLDLEYTASESVIIMPRNYPLAFRRAGELKRHYAVIGIGITAEGYPLYYDAVNEKGLGIAGLNFPGTADYKPYAEGRDNIAPFELIPWLLGQCADISEVRRMLERINIADIDFSGDVPNHPLHWIIDGRGGALTVEPVMEGLKIYDNPVGVLTNNPGFDFHMTNLNNYMRLSPEEPGNSFSDKLDLKPLSRGAGAFGLPGDASSVSRFVRAAFVKLNSVSGDSEGESVSQFFHILGAVEQQRGCTHIGGGKYEMTQYSACCNTDKGIYYYKTYDCSAVNRVDMRKENLDGENLILYPLIKESEARPQN